MVDHRDDATWGKVDEVEHELIGRLRFDAERVQPVVREVLDVVCHDPFRPSADRSSEYVSVVGGCGAVPPGENKSPISAARKFAEMGQNGPKICSQFGEVDGADDRYRA